MGQVNKILLTNFRNFENFELSFNAKCNILYGANGSGKTNILEAISLLGKGRGFRNSNLLNLIYKNTNYFKIKSEFQFNDNVYNLDIYSKLINDKQKKITSVNDEVSKEVENFINSSISFLFFLPEMERLFLASPSYRRNFIDKLIFSENKNYNKTINRYKKNLIERAKVLQNRDQDLDWLNVLEKQISENGIEIYKLRKDKVNSINNQIKIINKGDKYPFGINLQIKDNYNYEDFDTKKYIKNLSENRTIDANYGGSKIGPHKSDITATINKNVDASQLSTGQQKTLVLMILIAQCDYLISTENIKPILLLDEICSHLDHFNRDLLLDFSNQFDIQLFLTGTEKSMFSFMSTNTNFYNIMDQ